MLAQRPNITIRGTWPSGQHQPHFCIQPFVCIDQEVAGLFRRKPPQEQNVLIRFEPPPRNLVDCAMLAQRGFVRNVNGFRTISFRGVRLKRSGNDHRLIGQKYGRSLTEAKNSRSKSAPLLAANRALAPSQPFSFPPVSVEMKTAMDQARDNERSRT